MSGPELQQVGRLAMRGEGDWWVAYYAEVGTMDGAHELARVSMGLVREQKRRDQFIGLMRELYADLVEGALGIRPTFPEPPQPAPEHERSGHA